MQKQTKKQKKMGKPHLRFPVVSPPQQLHKQLEGQLGAKRRPKGGGKWLLTPPTILGGTLGPAVPKWMASEDGFGGCLKAPVFRGTRSPQRCK